MIKINGLLTKCIYRSKRISIATVFQSKRRPHIRIFLSSQK